MGFSQNTCLPAATARNASSACSVFGEVTYTASTRESISSKSLVASSPATRRIRIEKRSDLHARIALQVRRVYARNVSVTRKSDS